MADWQSLDPEAAREAEKYDNPIPSRELILQHLSERGSPAAREELVAEFGSDGYFPADGGFLHYVVDGYPVRLIGLDTILFSIEGLYEQFSDSKFRPCPLLRKMVDAGLLGRKSGKGFYDYGVGN